MVPNGFSLKPPNSKCLCGLKKKKKHYLQFYQLSLTEQSKLPFQLNLFCALYVYLYRSLEQPNLKGVD